MAAKVKWIKIRDCDYSITHMDGVRALEGFGTLAKFLGGPLGRLLSAGMAAKMTGVVATSPEMLAAAMEELGGHMSSPEFRDLVYRMLEGATVKFAGTNTPMISQDGNNKELFKAHFAGDIGSMLGLIWFALKENYGGFLDAIPGAGAMIQQLQVKGLDLLSQKDKTGELAA